MHLAQAPLEQLARPALARQRTPGSGAEIEDGGDVAAIGRDRVRGDAPRRQLVQEEVERLTHRRLPAGTGICTGGSAAPVPASWSPSRPGTAPCSWDTAWRAGDPRSRTCTRG